ncbi:MAG: hypothetical protein M3040_18175, partial [Bacteroidota bacterium]|nr:hypothetical protein [Bacteroidota bacterium]
MTKFYCFFLLIFPAIIMNAQTVWNGPTITFTKASGVSTSSATGQDKITNNIWLTRDVAEGLFNIAAEASYTKRSTSPAGTEWAYGNLASYRTLIYQTWEVWNGKNPPSMINNAAVLHIIDENIYIGITFNSWGANGTGAFSYTRTTASALPVTLANFSASVSGQSAVLKWSTVTEVDNDHFDIEHSLNGKDFELIAQVKAAGSSTIQRSYSYIDANVTAGKHFYRIMDVDKSNNRRYSQIISLSSGSNFGLQLYPNPATSIIAVTASSLLQGSEFIITSLAGQAVLK